MCAITNVVVFLGGAQRGPPGIACRACVHIKIFQGVVSESSPDPWTKFLRCFRFKRGKSIRLRTNSSVTGSCSATLKRLVENKAAFTNCTADYLVWWVRSETGMYVSMSERGPFKRLFSQLSITLALCQFWMILISLCILLIPSPALKQVK